MTHERKPFPAPSKPGMAFARLGVHFVSEKMIALRGGPRHVLSKLLDTAADHPGGLDTIVMETEKDFSVRNALIEVNDLELIRK